MKSALLSVDDGQTTLDYAPFDYAALNREQEAIARSDAALIRHHVVSSLRSNCAVGEALKRQKKMMSHEAFVSWLHHEFRWSYSSAMDYVAISNVWTPKFQSSGTDIDFSLISKSACLVYSRDNTPKGVRDTVDALLVKGQRVTAPDIERMKEEARAASSAIADLEAEKSKISNALEEARELNATRNRKTFHSIDHDPNEVALPRQAVSTPEEVPPAAPPVGLVEEIRAIAVDALTRIKMAFEYASDDDLKIALLTREFQEFFTDGVPELAPPDPHFPDVIICGVDWLLSCEGDTRGFDRAQLIKAAKAAARLKRKEGAGGTNKEKGADSKVRQVAT